MNMKKILYIVSALIFISYNTVLSQNIKAEASIDTNNVLIGDQLHYEITAQAPAGSSIIFPIIKDSIGPVVFLQTYKTDTLEKKDQITLRKQFLITCFDSGTQNIPPQPVLINRKGFTVSDTAFTNNVSIRFLAVKVDTTKPFKDIKPIIDEPLTFWDYFPYILIVLGIIGLAVLGIWLWKKYKKKGESKELTYDPSIPPHILAKEALLQLQNEKLWQKGELKLYHSRLSDILRTYIERKFDFLAMEMTTSEIISELNERNFNKELISKLKEILTLADLVKFAKYHPLPDENAQSMTLALNFVELTAPSDISSSQSKEDDDVQ